MRGCLWGDADDGLEGRRVRVTMGKAACHTRNLSSSQGIGQHLLAPDISQEAREEEGKKKEVLEKED